MEEFLKHFNVDESCRVATAHDTVLNSECAFTFHTPFTTPKGILVSLNTFMATIEDLVDTSVDGMYVRIVKERVEKKKEKATTLGENDEEKKEITKLSDIPSDEDQFETVSRYAVVCVKKSMSDAGGVNIVAEEPFSDETKSTLFPKKVQQSVDSIILHSGLAVQQDLSAWELDDQPKPVSKYANASLPFVDNGKAISSSPSDWKCEVSGDTENLWLNLSDGFIGGGRKNWDGSGGSNGAIDHYHETGEQYPLVVKLGTITGSDLSTADCYSYAKDEDGPVTIPNLGELLSKRGIKVADMQKTAKSTAELEVELNATYAFDAITEAGALLKPMTGPGYQGLQNLGNSCYMNSVVQVLFNGNTIPELAKRYHPSGSAAPLQKGLTPKESTTDVLSQTSKLVHALTSGEFSAPMPPTSAVVTDATSTNPKYRLQPRMFKHVVGGNHVDFRTGQQQDAAQYLQHLLEVLDRAESAALTSKRLQPPEHDGEAEEPLRVTSDLFAFKTTARLECTVDKKIKYKESAPESILSLAVPMEKATVIAEEEFEGDGDKEMTDAGVEEGEAATTEGDGAPDEKRPKLESSDDSKETSANEKANGDEKLVPTIKFQDCLESWGANTTVDDYRWPHLGHTVAPAISQTRLTNFPRYLFVQIQRYTLGADWTPQKLEVKLHIPQDLDLTSWKATGPKDGEDLVPDDDNDDNDAGSTTVQQLEGPPPIDEGALTQLMDMGFGYNGCKRALTAVGGSDVQAAMNWVFEHSQDADFNDPLPEQPVVGTAAATAASTSSSGKPAVDEGVVMSLVESLGCFTIDQVRAALKETSGAADRAADWLFSHMDDLDGAIASLEEKAVAGASSSSKSKAPLEDSPEGKYTMVAMISHIGKHTGSGHYVAHLKTAKPPSEDGNMAEKQWVIFNDEKVAISESPPLEHAYLYLFQRKDTIGSPNPHY